MKRLVICAVLLLAVASMISIAAQSGPPAVRAAASAPRRVEVATSARPAAAPAPRETFQEYCFECHGSKDPAADLSIERLLELSSRISVGAYWQEWERVAEMLESR